MHRFCVDGLMSLRKIARATLVALALAGATTPARAVERPSAGAVPDVVPAASAEEQEPQPPARRRFEEEVEVVAEEPSQVQAPAELAVRPAAVMAVAGAAENVFRTLQTLPGIAATTEFDSRISVRGGSPDENLTIMDGVEIHNPYRLFGLTSAFNPETVRGFDLYAGAFSSKYGDRLSSLLVVENRPGSDTERLSGSTALSLTDANAVFEGRLPGQQSGSWIVTGRRTYYDLVANSLVGTELPAFGDLQGRLDWNLRPGTRLTFFGLLSREATDAFFEGDRAGEQGDFVTTARNDLAALRLTTLLGRRASSRTILSFYDNRDRIDADARFRADARRSNAPDDDVGFRLADIAFTRELGVRDLALRQELTFATGAHRVESGLEVHRLRTETAWRIEGDRNPTASNGSSVQGGAGLPSDLDSAVDSTRIGAWLQDRWQAGRSLSLEAGLRIDGSGVNRRTTLSPRASATLRLGEATRLRAGGGLFSQSPGYEKLAQADTFVDLSGELGRSLLYERAAHVVVGVERDFAGGVSARVEGYWKRFEDLIVGRLETEEEQLARVARYDFPDELASSIPTDRIITSFPVNDARGRSWGFDLLVQKRPTPGARLTGWASYTWGRAEREEYGRTLPFEYDRRHAASLVGSWRISPKWELGATARAFSGFPRTPVLGLRVAADETAAGRLVPALDADGRYVYETTSGGVSNLNTARLPAFFRLDLRLSWKPRGAAGRWLLYLDVINATNRDNVGQVDPRLDYDPGSALDQPRLVLEPTAAIPFLPSIGVRFRF
jgi:outer membrane receptor protein involved in Fe transport